MLVANMTKHVEDIILFRKNLRKIHSQIHSRTFTHWCNLFLKSKGFEIQSISALEDGICVLVLLEIVSGKNFFEYNIETSTDEDESVVRNWKIIQKHFEEEDIDIPKVFPDSRLDESEKSELLTYLVWRIILRYQIYEDSMDKNESRSEFDQGSFCLMKWVRSKLNKHPINNWTTDWMTGVFLCDLVNAVRPDTVPESMFRQTKNPEMNVRLACTSAEDELGIPELIAPNDIANGLVDDKSMMTYIALFRSADRMIKQGISSKPLTSVVSATSEIETESNTDIVEVNKQPGIPYLPARCIAFGAGLRWGQVGKSADFIVQLNGVQAGDLSVSIECRPYDHRAELYKPELQIKPISETSYIVRYTPTRPGEYIINIFCSGEHIPNSPFKLSVTETVLFANDFVDDEMVISLDPQKPPVTRSILLKTLESSSSVDSKHDSAFVDDDSIRTPSPESISPPPWLDSDFHELYKNLSQIVRPEESPIKAFGKGLHIGEVGNISSFRVHTPNTDNGPLSVSITCPAMSLPVPCVKTKFQPTFLVHEVLYVPTEPGIYEITVKWGNTELNGSPFRLTVMESEEAYNQDMNWPHSSKLKSYRISNKHTVFVYYSATSKTNLQHEYKDQLVEILHKNNSFDTIFPIPIDIELSAKERKDLYDLANTRQLPFVFVNDNFIGTYDDIVTIHSKDNLRQFISSKLNTMINRITTRLSSSS